MRQKAVAATGIYSVGILELPLGAILRQGPGLGESGGTVQGTAQLEDLEKRGDGRHTGMEDPDGSLPRRRKELEEKLHLRGRASLQQEALYWKWIPALSYNYLLLCPHLQIKSVTITLGQLCSGAWRVGKEVCWSPKVRG